MLAPRLCVRSVIGSGTFADHTNASRSNSSSISSSIRFGFGAHRWRRPHPVLFVSCNSSRGSGASRSTNAEDDSHHQFLEASLLLSETMLHYQMRRQGFQGDKKWKAPGQLTSFSIPGKKPQIGIDLIGEGLLHRFQSPTIFLKISCDGDFLLPIIVGEFAVKKLIESQWEDNNGDYPDQFQLFRDLVEKLGYEVNMVKITERVINTYFARLYFSKRGKNDILSVDARPSDAINVAQRCKAPIYVSREIVLTDAIRIGYGMGRMRDAKPTYDVSLDSAADSPDVLSEELDLVKNMDLAVKEERYKDAAMWRDKLVKLRETIHEH
ncbi:bifunctional nuclease 2 isoform X1 [Juglans microcarpa x Juglans regia]|uniref:bifunctional nuclease 2 isoform X1 n=2 Tax=Juglans microcarpa x Juglans regia TaxID=2249226 RepID=UPI001B7E6965|nr:bifunctional nuclease 2 isoform X1 [Juglans microcarpa x Juglans regia]XP_041022832.1 bifunctional nuclease 2 isoform X1 [Juglans microcarpa x Juglans regia]